MRLVRSFPWFLSLFLVVPVSGQVLEPLPAAQGVAAATGPERAELLNASMPEADLLAAGQPTAEELGQLAAAGYKTVLDLRAPEESRGFDEPARVQELGMTYLNVPVVSAELDRAMLDRFREALKAAERPVLVHCGTSNRVGAALFAHWVLDTGLAPDAALERAKAAGLKSTELEHKVRALVEPTP